MHNEKSQLIKNTFQRFNSNIGALHLFFENIPKAADEIDKIKLKLLVDEVAFIFKDKPEAVEEDFAQYIPSMNDLDVYPDFRKNDSAKLAISELKSPEIKEILLEWESKHPYRAQRFVKVYSSIFNNPPMNGVLIRRSMLVSLVTFFEVFLESLYRDHQLLHGEEKFEAEKSARKMMSGNWQQKLSNLGKVGLDIPVIARYFDFLFEITQRRNLLVHNDGIVDEKYIKSFPDKYNPGDHLLVSTQYFQKAINVIHMVGFLLHYNQLKQNISDNQTLNLILDDFSITSLEEKRYDLIIELSENSENLDLSEKMHHILLVNRAVAFRELANLDEVNKIISSLRISQHEWQIDIAISMLTNDYSALKRQIMQIPKSINIAKISRWPLFDPVKDEIWFKSLLMKKSNYSSKQKNKKR